jgi:hypothetical protein
MPPKSLSVAIVLLVISSALAVLASSGWTPQGNPESQTPLKARILTIPTITAYGISPANAGIGTIIHTWLTYTDADGDAPTYVRVTRATIFGFEQLQTPYDMTANGTGTYATGKQYYYDWLYFPFANTGNIKFEVKSGNNAEVTKTVIEFQEPAPTLTHSGVTPMNNSEGNYTFFTNFTDLFNGVPSYVRVIVDGTTYNMGKNNSTQVTWVTGVDYNTTLSLSDGNHTYSFHAASFYNKSGDQSSGAYWFIISPATGGPGVSFAMLLIIAVLIGAIVIIWRFK